MILFGACMHAFQTVTDNQTHRQTKRQIRIIAYQEAITTSDG